MNYKVPGVYIEEVSLFPPSVAAVATGIPAFIGHTANTQDSGGNTLINKPVRITSLLEFTQLFGDSYNPSSYTVQIDPADFSILAITPDSGYRYYLFDIIRHYFDNGGGPCYIVSVGNYSSNVIYGADTTGLLGGLKAIEKIDEPTILVCADGVSLKLGNGSPDFVQAGNLHKALIAQCAALQDRVAILDMMEGYLPPNHASAPVDQFRNEVGTENLNYAATYYPWLRTTYLKDVDFSQFSFIDNQAIPVPVPDATLNTMTGDAATDGLLTTLRARLAEEGRIFTKVTAVTLNRNNYNPLTSHLNTLKDAVLAETTAAAVRPVFTTLVMFVRELALAFRDLENDTGNSSEMIQVLSTLEADTDLRDQITALIAFEKNAGVRNSISTTRTEANVDTDYTPVNNEDWIGGISTTTIAENGVDYTNSGANTVAQTAHEAANSSELQDAFDVIADAFVSLVNDIAFYTDQAEKALFTQHPFFRSLYDRIRMEMSLLPPSGAIAGVYAATDRTRGVWKAPANVSLRGVVAPACKLTDLDQETLNIHSTGKSVNAIRAFTGKGILVWGARTLAGNDNEWRYINVRRFFTFVEESAKKATEPFVFESNDANTWIRIRAMIENFLTLQWRQGALAGSTTKDAFFVKVGLGETMTAQDILEGRLIVEIGMAAVRPAEFIILRFSHKMQES